MITFMILINILGWYLAGWMTVAIVLATFWITYKVYQSIKEHGL